MISQLFILAPRGDAVVKREFRFDVPTNTPEVFFRAARFWRDGEKAPAVFHERGVNYLHVKVRLLPSTTREPRTSSPAARPLTAFLDSFRLPACSWSPRPVGTAPRAWC